MRLTIFLERYLNRSTKSGMEMETDSFSLKNRKMKNLLIVGMLFASMSVFAQNSPNNDVAKKENLKVCHTSNKMIKAPAQQVNDKEKSVRASNGNHQRNGHGVHGKNIEHKGRVAVPGSRKCCKVEEKM